MAESTVIKNKNLLVKVSFADKQPADAGKDFSAYSEVEIQKAQGIKEKYVQDENGKALKIVCGLLCSFPM